MKKMWRTFFIKVFFISCALRGAWLSPQFWSNGSLQLFLFFMCVIVLLDGHFEAVGEKLNKLIEKVVDKK